MITQYHKIALAATFGLAMAFTFSACSSEEPPPPAPSGEEQNSGNNTPVNCQFVDDGITYCYDKSWENPITYDECLEGGGTIVSSCPSVPPPPSNPTCGGNEYNPETEQCCGNNKFTTSTQFCSGNTVYDKCGGFDYNPSTHFCSGNTTYNKCGGSVVYNPSTEQCCGSNKFTTSTQFCSSNTVYPKCGGNTYDTSTEGCCGSSKFTTSKQFCDTRDNKIYKHTKIGNQTWMAENLAYKAIDSKCASDATICATYGVLYNWATAMGYSVSSATNPSGVKGVCPTGWHLPSHAEWGELLTAIGGYLTADDKLKSTSGWSNGNGRDSYGFAALPGGGSTGTSLTGLGSAAYWWSSTADEDNTKARIRFMNDNSVGMSFGAENKAYFLSVRCVKD
ncbi:MAG: hypothetical protein LBC64_02220 [Fibromonadaceae bacterium]|nr:hypothetical protein [Fibromonadaceae bacterium]